MPWSLKPLINSVPSGLAELPAEMLTDVVRAAVLKTEPIDVRHIDEEVDALIRPFTGLPLLLDIAEHEVMRVNVFQIHAEDDDDTLAGVDHWEVQLDDGKTEMINLLKYHDTGHLSERSRRILHLEVDCPVKISGGVFDHFRMRASINTVPLDEVFYMILGMLHESFPELQTLNMRTRNSCEDAPRFHFDLGDGTHGRDRNDPLFTPFAKIERIVRIQMLLTLMGALHVPGLKKKTLTFVQDESCTSQTVIDGSESHAPRPKGRLFHEERGGGPTHEEHCRIAFLFADLLGWDKSLARIGIYYRHGPTPQEVRAEELNGIVNQDIKMINEILQSPCVVVDYLCDGEPGQASTKDCDLMCGM